MRLLTIPEAANRLGLKPASLRMWIWTRSIEFVRVENGQFVCARR